MTLLKTREELRGELAIKTKELKKVEDKLTEASSDLTSYRMQKHSYMPAVYHAETQFYRNNIQQLNRQKKQINREITNIQHELGDLNTEERNARDKEWSISFVSVAQDMLSEKKFNELVKLTNKAVGDDGM
jgi:hypothetical protein